MKELLFYFEEETEDNLLFEEVDHSKNLIAQLQYKSFMKYGLVEFVYFINFKNRRYNQQNIVKVIDELPYNLRKFIYPKKGGIIYHSPMYKGTSFQFNPEELSLFTGSDRDAFIFGNLFDFEKEIFLLKFNNAGSKKCERVKNLETLHNLSKSKFLENFGNEKLLIVDDFLFDVEWTLNLYNEKAYFDYFEVSEDADLRDFPFLDGEEGEIASWNTD